MPKKEKCKFGFVRKHGKCKRTPQNINPINRDLERLRCDMVDMRRSIYREKDYNILSKQFKFIEKKLWKIQKEVDK